MHAFPIPYNANTKSYNSLSRIIPLKIEFFSKKEVLGVVKEQILYFKQ